MAPKTLKARVSWSGCGAVTGRMSCARLWTMLREWGERSGLRAVRVPHPEIQLGLPTP